jgi:glycine betaine/proline transport system substrate-binding protein
MKKFTRTALALGAVGALTLSGCAAGDSGAEGDSQEVSIAIPNGWAEGEAASYLWAAVLEEQGYTVETEYADIVPVFSGVSTGDYDVMLDSWLPNTHADYWEQYGDSMEDLGSWNDDAKNTIAVNEDAPIDSLDELAENADLFGNRIVGIEPGAGLTAMTQNEVIPGYGLEDMEFLTSSSPAMLGELQAATDAGENIVVTLWRPHWAYDAFPLKDLEDPEGTLGEAEGMHTLAREGFSDDLPEVAGWLEDFEMDSELLYSLQNEMFNVNDGSDHEAVVAAWIEENRDWVDSLTS